MDNMFAYLKLFYQSVFVPIHYYRGDECLLALPAVKPEADLTKTYRKLLLEKNAPLAYVATLDFLHYGIVRNFETSAYIILGPVITARIHPKRLPDILTDASISLDYKDQVGYLLQMVPLFSFDQFVNLMMLLYKELTGQLLDPHPYFQKISQDSIHQISQKHYETIYQTREDDIYHNTYELEQELCHYVENGDAEGLERRLKAMPQIHAGSIGENSLRQEKNVFIAAITLYTRHSIAGGLDVETAYHLSDTYIQKAEKTHTIDEITRLSQAAIFDFTRRVSMCKIPEGISQDVFKCIQYISAHINWPLSVEDVVDAVGKSRSHISRQFKKELGVSLNDFITNRKLEESKKLLAYTDKPISEISEYLCFSSQSYFQNVFKKKYAITPHEYRKATKR